MSFRDKLNKFILRLLGYEEMEELPLPESKPKMIPEELVIKVEQALTMCTELGILQPKDLGFYMDNYVCPVCPAAEGCPVPEIYQLMEAGADQATIKVKMEEAAGKLGVELIKTTPEFLKIKPDEENN